MDRPFAYSEGTARRRGLLVRQGRCKLDKNGRLRFTLAPERSLWCTGTSLVVAYCMKYVGSLEQTRRLASPASLVEGYTSPLDGLEPF